MPAQLMTHIDIPQPGGGAAFYTTVSRDPLDYTAARVPLDLSTVGSSTHTTRQELVLSHYAKSSAIYTIPRDPLPFTASRVPLELYLP